MVVSSVVEQPDSLFTVLDLVRDGVCKTRPELVRHSGMGRKVVTQRVEQLIGSGLLEEGDLGQSTGGRAPRALRFRSDGGNLLVAELGSSSISVGLADLAGRLIEQYEEPFGVTAGPDAPLHRVEELFDQMLASRPASSPPIWGIGIGVLGPVNAATGHPVGFAAMPGWGDYPVRQRLAARYHVPVWVDNEVNLMALGEFRSGLGKGHQDLVFVKIGTGIGAGLICSGRLHRGAQGAAGEVGHLTVVEDPSITDWCGNIGCLVQVASGMAIGRDAAAAAATGRSPYLAALLARGGTIAASDVAAGAVSGDPVSVEILTRAGEYVGRMATTLVNSFNPSLILIGGGVAGAGDLLLAAIRQSVYQRAMPLATRDLQVAFSPLSDRAGLVGAAFMVVDQLLSRRRLGLWIEHGSPVGLADRIHAGLAV